MKSKKIMRRILLVAGVIVVIAIIAVLPKNKGGMQGGNGSMPDSKGGMPEDGASANTAATVYSVTTQVLEKTELQEYLTMNGNVQANSTISVYPGIGGKITRVYVTLGSIVKRGDKLAEIDPSTPGMYYEISPVYAPISGTITALPLTVGTSVNTNTAVAQIGNIRELQIKAKVPERDVSVLKQDLKAQVSLVAYKNQIFDAHVIRVSPIVDEVSRTKEIYLAFDTIDPKINAGMYAKIKLLTVLHKDALCLPIDAIQTLDDKNFVYVVQSDSTVTVRTVEIGVNVDGIVEIVNGLSEGDKIVVDGTQNLSEGAQIKEAAANTASAL